MIRTSPKLVAAIAFAVVALTACPGPTDPRSDAGTPDSGEGGGQAPQLVGLTPTEGPLEGGTTVLITGNYFEPGAEVFFGAVQVDPQQVLVTSARRISAKTPPASAGGAVDLKVRNPDGQSATLAGAFLYDGPTAGIDEAKLVGPALVEDTSGADPVVVTVKADVEVAEVTAGDGAGAGIQAQVGFAKWSEGLALTELTWSDASYEGDVDGATAGDKARDRYVGQVTLPGAMGVNVDTWAVAVRFSRDGSTWTVADLDGVANGTSVAMLQKVRVSATPVDRCKLQFPDKLETREGVTSGKVYGWVWAKGKTDAEGQGAGISGEVGYGPVGSDPASDPEWHWSPATYNVDKDNGQADEYAATFTGPAAGDYQYAYRFWVANGPKTYCDLDGSDQGGYAPVNAGQLTSKAVGIDGCTLHGPATYSVVSGQTTAAISARVLAVSVTDGTGQGQNVTAELGYGPPGTQPGAAGWTFVPASYTGDQDNGTTDEYAATLTPGGYGLYDVAYRFSYGGGAPVYCDLDGSANGWTEAQAATVAVVPSCRLELVTTPGGTTAVSTAQSGDPLEAKARLFIQGVTSQSGAAPNVIAQVGVGYGNATLGTGWGWKDASFLQDDTATGEDVWSASFNPAYTASNRAVSFRFSTDNGATWAYCDQDGNAVGGYTEAEQASLVVNTHTEVDFCKLQSPSTLTQQTGTATPSVVYGRVYEAGVTDVANSGGSMVAELGYGQEGEDPGIAWTWVPASFNVEYGNDDEYQASFPPGVGAGTYHYAFRFRLPGSDKWCFSDLDGTGGNAGLTGFTGGTNLGQATVTP